MKNKICSIAVAVAVFFFIITFSIGLPIYFRPFYYVHISALELDAESGFTVTEIKEAYNEVLDYLTLPGKNFGVGVMKYSDEGMQHFADCKILFNINAAVLAISTITLIVIAVLRRLKKIKIAKLLKLSPCFWGATAAVVIPLVLGGIMALDFDKAFVVFHKIFFAGKENWLFNPRTDEIIKVLPQQFFMNCAIFIACGIIVLSSIVLIKEFILARKSRREKS